MGLFRSQPVVPPEPKVVPGCEIPVLPVDLNKRYDVYCSARNHDRLYEDVKIVALRTLEPVTEPIRYLMVDFVEIESADGSRSLLPKHGIQMLCEHGVEPAFKVLRRRRDMLEF